MDALSEVQIDFLAAGVAARMRCFSEDQKEEAYAAVAAAVEAQEVADFDVWVPARQLVGAHARDEFTVAGWPFESEAACVDFIRSGPLAGEGFRAMRLRDCPYGFAAQEERIKQRMRAVRRAEVIHQVLDARRPRAPEESADILPPRAA